MPINFCPRSGLIKAVLFSIFLIFVNNNTRANHPAAGETEIVLCIDLSGSTNGLIDNVRQNIWSLVNMVMKENPGGVFRIGIVGYSRPSFGKDHAYVKILSPLTTDYDGVTAGLWNLRSEVEKGDQFVSNAIEMTAYKMNWSKKDEALKIIFLIGNGNVNTGSGDYRSLVAEVKEEGIKIIPVYCARNSKSTDITGWSIIGDIMDEPLQTVSIAKQGAVLKPVPDGGRLVELCRELDKLTVPFTKEGIEYFTSVKTCDLKTVSLDPVAFQHRLYYRISDTLLTRVSKIDLVDMAESDSTILEGIDFSLLDKNLRKLSVTELRVKLNERRIAKKKIVSAIEKLLPVQRQEYINSIIASEDFGTDLVLEKVLLKKTHEKITTRKL